MRARVVLAFVMAGPPLGTFLVAAPMLLIWSEALSPGDALTVALMMALTSYIPGALPALLTGALVARRWSDARGWYAHVRTGLAGWLLSLACLGAAFALLGLDFDSVAETATLLLLCSLPGLIGATLVSRLLQALRGA